MLIVMNCLLVLFLHAFAELIWNTAVTKNCMVRLVEKYAKDEAAETQD